MVHPLFLFAGCSESVFVREIWFSRDKYLETEGVTFRDGGCRRQLHEAWRDSLQREKHLDRETWRDSNSGALIGAEQRQTVELNSA
jgi:hypothetical protein